MLISQFDYKAPTTIKEVLSCLHAHPDAPILSGGYSLISLIKSGVIDPDFIISTEQIQTLKKIDTESDGSVIIGSSVSLSTLLDHSSVGITFPSLIEVINNIADRQYCNQTSIGDEFSYQGGSMGVLAVLLSYGAEFHFSNCNGSETIKGLTLEEKPKKAILTIKDQKNPERGSVDLVFSGTKLELKEFTIKNENGSYTSILLKEIEYPKKLNETLFSISLETNKRRQKD